MYSEPSRHRCRPFVRSPEEIGFSLEARYLCAVQVFERALAIARTLKRKNGADLSHGRNNKIV